MPLNVVGSVRDSVFSVFRCVSSLFSELKKQIWKLLRFCCCGDKCPTTMSSRAGSARRQTPKDFYFGRLIGEGSFSCVYLAREVAAEGREVAIKVCEKRHILKERKTEYIQSEKIILAKITAEWEERRPFFVRLHSTFQDPHNLYFVITYAKNGDLLKFIEKMAERDIDCTQFYAGQVLSAVEFLHERGILHRDLKPENILLNERMHVLITDFGSAKLLAEDENGENAEGGTGEPVPKRASFVGTAQYVSPEILTGRPGSSRASDLWAIGCVLYQMCTGLPPFQSQSEYLIFQKIQKLEYSFHEGFDDAARDLITKLLVIDPDGRLGAKDATYYTSIRAHPFFDGLDFSTLHEATPPTIKEFVPAESLPDPVWNRNPNLEPGAENLARLQIDDATDNIDDELSSAIMRPISGSDSQSISSLSERRKNIANLSERERREFLEEQAKSNKFHKFVEGNLIIKQGILDKKKGLWSRRRMFLLTEGPRLFYVDPDNMVLKGEIPWSNTLKPEIRDFKIFFVHTPGRVYYLIDPNSTAKDWCFAIDEVRQFYYGGSP